MMTDSLQSSHDLVEHYHLTEKELVISQEELLKAKDIVQTKRMITVGCVNAASILTAFIFPPLREAIGMVCLAFTAASGWNLQHTSKNQSAHELAKDIAVVQQAVHTKIRWQLTPEDFTESLEKVQKSRYISMSAGVAAILTGAILWSVFPPIGLPLALTGITVASYNKARSLQTAAKAENSMLQVDQTVLNEAVRTNLRSHSSVFVCAS